MGGTGVAGKPVGLRFESLRVPIFLIWHSLMSGYEFGGESWVNSSLLVTS
jgi:hypothetical protein